MGDRREYEILSKQKEESKEGEFVGKVDYTMIEDPKSVESSKASKETRAALAATLILKSGGSFGTAAQVIDSILNQSETETSQQQIVSKAANAATTILAAGGSFDKTVNRMANILRDSRECDASKNDGEEDEIQRSHDENGTQSSHVQPSIRGKDLVTMGRSVDGRSVDGRSMDAQSVDIRSCSASKRSCNISHREEKSKS